LLKTLCQLKSGIRKINQANIWGRDAR